jgi:hypothetical protein
MATPITKAVETVEDSGKKRMRSPAYPYINLETALRRAKEFHDKENRGLAFMKVAAKHWGYEEKSSGALQTAAALISFGLMRDEGTGEKRKLQLTQTALRIILDTRADSSDREGAIKEAALSPKIHKELWKRFEPTVSNDQLRHTLILDWTPPFNENSVDGFIREYRDTIAFAKLSESDKVASEDGKDGDGGKGSIQIGDYVQWESMGVLQFQEPKRIRELSPDGKYAFVDGQYAGLPMEQLTREKAPSGIPSNPATPTEPHKPLLPNKHMQEFVVPLSDGSRAVFQWPNTLSKEDVADLKDSLEILQRKIMRSVASEEKKEKSA